LTLVFATLVAACAAPAQQAPSVAPAPDNTAPTSSQSTGPKRIVTAVVGQPNVWVERLRSGPRIGAWNLYELTTAGLTYFDAQGQLRPQLAQAVPL